MFFLNFGPGEDRGGGGGASGCIGCLVFILILLGLAFLVSTNCPKFSQK